MDPSWFTKALNAEASRRRLSHRALARFLDRGKSSITNWMVALRYPAFAEFCDVCERLQWDLGKALPPAVRRAAEGSLEQAQSCPPDNEIYAQELMDMVLDALASENTQVKHFALAVLEDPSLALSDKQAAKLAEHLVELSKDKHGFLASHFAIVANRLLNQSDAVVPLLGHLLVSSTNILVRYRALAGFLDHSGHCNQSIHFVRSALLDRELQRSGYELSCLEIANGNQVEDGGTPQLARLVESVRLHAKQSTVYGLVLALDSAMQDVRGEFAWYHALDAAARCDREGPAMLMGAYRQLERMSDNQDALNRRRDIVATINRAGVESTVLCEDFLREAASGADLWIAFHAVAALGKWAPKDPQIASLLAVVLTGAIASHTEEGPQVGPLCCYALAKIGVDLPEVVSALTQAKRSKDAWLRAIARVAESSLKAGSPIQETLVQMLEAA